MEIHTPSIPKRFAIPESLIEELLTNPALAARVLLGERYDAFQQGRLTYHWWTPIFEDHSGYSSGKTAVNVAYLLLRLLLWPGPHTALVMYKNFEQGKNTFMLEFGRMLRQSAFLRAHLGKDQDHTGRAQNGKTGTKGQSAWKIFFKPDKEIILPAPNWRDEAGTLASMRANTILLEEWTHVDADTQSGDLGGITGQIIGRATKASFNQHHPIWAPHIHRTAPAKKRTHPSYRRHRSDQREVEAGNPTVVTRGWSFKDYSNFPGPEPGKSFRDSFRIERNTSDLKRNMLATASAADWMAEGLGIWATSGSGFYAPDAITGCRKTWVEMGCQLVDSAAQPVWQEPTKA